MKGDDDATRKRALARALAHSKSGEIAVCDSCEMYALSDDMHEYTGSMGKSWVLCPECDLPEKWHSKFSDKRGIRYYVYFDPRQPNSTRVQWGHPTDGNPLQITGDTGQTVQARKRRRGADDSA